MKAILLIDVPDNTEFDKDYRLTGLLLANKYTENVGIEFKDASLKPLPDKIDQGYPCDKYEEGYGDGWDSCIDEILGDKE